MLPLPPFTEVNIVPVGALMSLQDADSLSLFDAVITAFPDFFTVTFPRESAHAYFYRPGEILSTFLAIIAQVMAG